MPFTTVRVNQRYALGSQPGQGTVLFSLSNGISDGMGNSVAPVTIVCTLDSGGNLLGPDGSLGVVLQANDDATTTPSNTAWVVQEKLGGFASSQFAVKVPHSMAPTTTLSQLPEVASISSPAFVLGPQGDPGTPGATGPPPWKLPVAWSSTTAYAPGPPADLVVFSGVFYLALAPNTNVTPGTNGAVWQALSGASGSVDLNALHLSASSTVVTTPTQFGGVPFLSPVAEGVVGDGVTDDTTSWQSTLTAAGLISVPKGRQSKITSTLNAASLTTIKGGGYPLATDSNHLPAACSMLIWGGSATPPTGTALLQAHDVEGCAIEEMFLHLGPTPGLIGVNFVSDNAPASHNLEMKRCTFYGDASTPSGIAVSVGDGSHEADRFILENMQFFFVDTALWLRGPNAGNQSKLDVAYILAQTYGVRFTNVGSQCAIKNVTGAVISPAGALFLVDGPNFLSPVIIENCEDENIATNAGVAPFLLVTSASGGAPIVLTGNTVNSPIVVTAANIKISSRGNTYNKAIRLSGAGTVFQSDGTDTFTPGFAVTDGATTNGSTTVTNATSAPWTANYIGTIITGPGIPPSTYIVSITDSAHAVMSAAATATASGLTLTIGAAGIIVSGAAEYRTQALSTTNPMATLQSHNGAVNEVERFISDTGFTSIGLEDLTAAGVLWELVSLGTGSANPSGLGIMQGSNLPFTIDPGAVNEGLHLTSSGVQLLTDLHLALQGAKARYAEGGANATAGVASLSSGTATVSTTAVTSSSRFEYWRQGASGTLGDLSIGTVTPGTSFQILSSSASDNSNVYWRICEPG